MANHLAKQQHPFCLRETLSSRLQQGELFWLGLHHVLTSMPLAFFPCLWFALSRAPHPLGSHPCGDFSPQLLKIQPQLSLFFWPRHWYLTKQGVSPTWKSLANAGVTSPSLAQSSHFVAKLVNPLTSLQPARYAQKNASATLGCNSVALGHSLF